MINFANTKTGDKVKVVGAGAPGFAKLGDILTVTSCNGNNKLYAKNEAGDEAYFALTCGAARLEPVATPLSPTAVDGSIAPDAGGKEDK